MKAPVTSIDCGTDNWTVVLEADFKSPRCDLRLLWADDSDSLSILKAAGSDSLDADHDIYVVRFTGLATFTLWFGSRTISIVADAAAAPSTIQHLLVDQIWPRIIAHRGALVLHAAGVLTDQGAMLLIGRSGDGKSTLAASFHQRCCRLLGDDAMIVSDDGGEQRVRAVYRSLRLFPDAIATLFGTAVEESEVASYTAKKNIHVDPSPHRTEKYPVRGLFFLNPPSTDDTPKVDGLSPAIACMRMIEHSFWLDPTDQALTIRKMASASALANAVPAYDLHYPRDFAILPSLHDRMLAVLPTPRTIP